MHPSKRRILLGIISSIVLLLFLFLLDFSFTSDSFKNNTKTFFVLLIILTGIINCLLIIIWIGFGRAGGIIASVLSLGFIQSYFFDPFRSGALYYFISWVSSVIVGYRFQTDLFILEQGNKVENEKIVEQTNIVLDTVEQNKKELLHLDRRLVRYINLNDITEKFSSSLAEDDITGIIVENTYNLFGKADRVLLFRVDTVKQELRLVYSKKSEDILHIRTKTGDIFDRWVFWKRQPLLVENTRKDFRFSLKEEDIDHDFHSLISVPLISGEKVLGVLRMDSKIPYYYTQEDLRLLFIISGLASVALENAILYKRLSELAMTDGLTSLYVHKYCKERIKEEVKRTLKTGTPFSLLLLDIDGFKSYNDTYGHMAGDLVLKHIASILRKHIYGGDIAARYGGEEFAILLLGRSKRDAMAFSEEMRRVVEDTPMVLRRKKTYITISVGIATCPFDSQLSDDLLRLADSRLYKAKKKGKNRVCAS